MDAYTKFHSKNKHMITKQNKELGRTLSPQLQDFLLGLFKFNHAPHLCMSLSVHTQVYHILP